MTNKVPYSRGWPEASSMSSDGEESATVLNSQHRETAMPFISDTKQQKGTPVYPLTRKLSFTLPFPNFKSSVLPSSQTVLFEAKVKAWELEVEAKVKAFEARALEVEAKALKAKACMLELMKAWEACMLVVVLRMEAWEALEAKALEEAKALKAWEAKAWEAKMLKALKAKAWELEAKAWEEIEAKLKRMEELKLFIFRLMRTASFKKAMAFLPFSLKELISLLKSLRSGWGPPLEMAARMLNSKFWVMEADVWADLLIVCCWANPTIYCEKCRNNVKLATTSCKHVVCPVCVVGQGMDPSCPECGQALTVSFSRKRRLCEPTKTATKRPCTDSDSPGSCSHESQSKSFTIKDLHELLESLYPALNEWYYLGLALGVPDHILKAIETKQSKSLDCLKDMLSMRLKEKLSKDELIKSLQKQTVGLSELAQTLKDSKQW